MSDRGQSATAWRGLKRARVCTYPWPAIDFRRRTLLFQYGGPRLGERPGNSVGSPSLARYRSMLLPSVSEHYNTRFGRVARDASDVHRPLLPEQKLVDIFQEQHEAKVSGQLTLNYKRVLYMLENCADNRCIARKTVQVYEDEDGWPSRPPAPVAASKQLRMDARTRAARSVQEARRISRRRRPRAKSERAPETSPC
jgi:hypothetical protein